MKLFTAPRQAGKTRVAVEVCIEIDAYLLVRNRQEAQRVFELYRNKGLRFPVTYDEILKYPLKQSRLNKIVVDNVEDFAYHVLTRQCGVFPVMGTIDQDFMCSGQLRDLVEIEREKKAEQEYKFAEDMKKIAKIEKEMRGSSFMLGKIEEDK